VLAKHLYIGCAISFTSKVFSPDSVVGALSPTVSFNQRATIPRHIIHQHGLAALGRPDEMIRYQVNTVFVTLKIYYCTLLV